MPRSRTIPVAADLYDPFPIENLHYARTLGEGTARHDRATLDLALGRGDFFLCASPEQRLFYAGALFARGRIGPSNFPEDPALGGFSRRSLSAFPSRRRRDDRAAGRRAAGVPEAGPLVLFGGIYDWYDPGPLLAAWPEVSETCSRRAPPLLREPEPRTRRPRASSRPRAPPRRRIDPEGRSIVFSPWLPYASRADLYAAADLAISIASEGLETELAYRTRLLDAAWGGVPSVAVAGGTLARELASAGAAIECGRDAHGLAVSVSGLLLDGPRRKAMGRAARTFAAERVWGNVAAPLRACGAERPRGSGPAAASGGGRGGWRRRLPPRANL